MKACEITVEVLEELRSKGVRSLSVSDTSLEVEFYPVYPAEVSAALEKQKHIHFMSLEPDDRAAELRKREESLLYGSS